MKLIEVRGKYTTFNLSMEEKIQAKDRIEQRNKLLERDVQRHKEREKHTEKIGFLEKKKPWIEYKMAREQYVEANADKTNMYDGTFDQTFTLTPHLSLTPTHTQCGIHALFHPDQWRKQPLFRAYWRT